MGIEVNGKHVSHHTAQGWKGQFQRTRRWLERLKQVRGRTFDSDLTDDILDYAYAFFQNCYHIGDWLVADNVLSEAKRKNLFNEKPIKGVLPTFQICRDICNGTKHLKIDRNPLDPNFAVIPGYVPEGGKIVGNWIVIVGDYPVADESWVIDIFELADKCLSKWVRFLEEIERKPIATPP